MFLAFITASTSLKKLELLPLDSTTLSQKSLVASLKTFLLDFSFVLFLQSSRVWTLKIIFG
jgi:hypothetical protein